MSGLRRTLRALLRDDGGATLVEYALVLAVLSLAAVTALLAFGDAASQRLSTDGDALTASGRVAP